MVAITYRNGVSIGEIVVYVPALAMAVLLVIRHGVKSGWFFLIVVSLARIIGSCLQLAATMSGHIRIPVLTASSIVQNIGLSPLMMTALAFLSRIIMGINRNLGQQSLPSTVVLKFTQVIIGAALIIGIAGGVKASEQLQKTGKFILQPSGKAAVGLFIIAYVLIVLAAVLSSYNVSHAEPEDKSLLLAVGLSLPFLLVRIIYSSISSFDSKNLPAFNQISGSVTVWLCMAIIMEIVVVFIFETVGFLLNAPEAHESHLSS